MGEYWGYKSMIVSVSRRTDIPALYSEWFIRRLAEGYAMVANPYNAGQVRRVSLLQEDVDAFVLWSKNPAPLFASEAHFEHYPWLLQYTLNGYPAAVEPGVPELTKRLNCLTRIAAKHGPLRVNWRYDPILLADGIDAEYHKKTFKGIARVLEGYVQSCTISFIDEYAGLEKRMHGVGLVKMEEAQMRDLAGELARIGKEHGMILSACAEPYDFTREGVLPGKCVDADRLSQIAGRQKQAKKDKNQRPGCGCAASVDIGRYGTCINGCLYCYAVKGTLGRLAAGNDDRL